jgi:FkbM family methyltransferase
VTVARTGFDPDIAVRSALLRFAARAPSRAKSAAPETPASPAARPVVTLAPRFVGRPRQLGAQLSVAAARVADTVFGGLARTARFFLTKELRRELVEQAELNANHFNHELARANRELTAIRQLLERATDDGLRRDEMLMREAEARHDALVRMVQRTAQDVQRLATDTTVALDGLGIRIATQRDVLASQLERLSDLSSRLVRRVVIPGRAGHVLVRTAVGYVVVPADDEIMLAYLAEVGDPEPGPRSLIETVLRPGGVFVDVGANLGVHTLAAAGAVGPSGRVIAFEPFPATAEALRSTVAVNGFVDRCEIFELAAWDQPGEHRLLLGATSGHHSLVSPISKGNPDDVVTVRTARLDDVLGPEARVDLVKIDVEGAELRVIEGARGLIESNAELLIIAELGAIHLEHAGTNLEQWLAAFAELGLEWRLIDPVSGALRVADPEELLSIDSSNLLFARPQALAELIGSM